MSTTNPGQPGASTSAAAVDGFEISRRGDANINCRIVLHLASSPDRYRILPPLADILTIKEGTRAEIMAALWKFIKTSNAQDKQDPSIVKRIPALEPLMEGDTPFHKLPEIVSHHLTHPDPVIIPYTIRVDQDALVSPKCWDIPVEIDDPFKSRVAPLLANQADEKEINQLEDKVGELAYFARDLKQKKEFLEAFRCVLRLHSRLLWEDDCVALPRCSSTLRESEAPVADVQCISASIHPKLARCTSTRPRFNARLPDRLARRERRQYHRRGLAAERSVYAAVGR